MFLLSRLWARVLFDSGVSHSFIAASVVIELGLEVETLKEPLYVSSPLGIRARIGMICRGFELEILGTLLIVDLRIMDMSGVHEVFHVSMLRKYTPDPAHVVDWGQIEVDTNGTFEEGPVCNLDSRDKVLRHKTVKLVRVLWRHYGVEESTWECEDTI